MRDRREKPRFVYLDVVKCIAMLSVCLYHFPLVKAYDYANLWTVQGLLNRYLYGFNVVCVPLFMMVNGALLLNKPFDLKKHAVRTLKLFIGIFVWFLITLVTVHGVRNGAAYVGNNISGMLNAALYLYGYDGITLTHLWFVQMLVAVYVLLPLLMAAFQSSDKQFRSGVWFFAGIVGVWCFVFHDFELVKAYLPGLRRIDLAGMDLMNPIRSRYGAMIVYFLLGGVMHKQINRLQKWPIALPLLMIGIGSVLLFAEGITITRTNEAVYDIVYYGYHCLPALSMAMGVFMLIMRTEGQMTDRLGRVVALVGRNTLAIYYLHWIVGLLVTPMLDGVQGMGANLCKAVVMVYGCALVGEGMRRIPLLRELV